MTTREMAVLGAVLSFDICIVMAICGIFITSWEKLFLFWLVSLGGFWSLLYCVTRSKGGGR